MTTKPAPNHFFARIQRLALLAVGFGVLLTPVSGRGVERAPRQNRPGLRAPAGGAQRGGGGRVDAESREAAFESEATTAAGGLWAPVAAILPQPAYRADSPAVGEKDVPPGCDGEALRARPQAPTFGRPPPL